MEESDCGSGVSKSVVPRSVLVICGNPFFIYFR